MDEEELRAFADSVGRPDGAIVATRLMVSASLIDDADFLLAPYIAEQNIHAARAFYDDPDCEYIYLTKDEYEYEPGPFDYLYTPGDIPDGAVMFVGRVRVTRKKTV